MLSQRNWIDALFWCQSHAIPFVLVTVVEERGSTPRDSGSKMVITATDCFDTIGGGNLEHQVTRNARKHIENGINGVFYEEYNLSQNLGQCCGGMTKIMLEVHQVQRQHIAIFGAGHVAKALVTILSELPMNVLWFDEREGMFPPNNAFNITSLVTEEPHYEVKTLPANTSVLVMTHKHQQDFDIVAQAIKRDDLALVGMIGSETKAKRFRYRLKQQGYSEEQSSKLVSPVGDLAIMGKEPMAVAVSIAAQLLASSNDSKPVQCGSPHQKESA